MLSTLASTVVRVDALTVRQRDLLDFERAWRFRYGGSKDSAIHDLFACSPTRYYQELMGTDSVIDLPAAVAYDPVTVNRLRRLRETRQRSRTGR